MTTTIQCIHSITTITLTSVALDSRRNLRIVSFTVLVPTVIIQLGFTSTVCPFLTASHVGRTWGSQYLDGFTLAYFKFDGQLINLTTLKFIAGIVCFPPAIPCRRKPLEPAITSEVSRIRIVGHSRIDSSAVSVWPFPSTSCWPFL